MVDYLKSQWLDNPAIPREEWNFFDESEEDPSNNNMCEGGNWSLQCRMKTNHPNTYRFFNVIKKELVNTAGRVDQALDGLLEKHTCRRTKKTQQTRNNLRSMYRNGEIDLRRLSRGTTNL